jgi:chloramphenicol 3-O phosphotransferase
VTTAVIVLNGGSSSGKSGIARGDRIAGMAASQADLVHQGVEYDLEVDTARAEALDCARAIAVHVR